MFEEPMRIAKYIARAGLCSRRDAEQLITQGRVTLNGEVIMSPALNVSAQDQVFVDGLPLYPEVTNRLWLFYKPRGVITTQKDPHGRQTVFDLLPPKMPRVISVDRLDLNTEGLLLMTNAGELARYFEHPSSEHKRTYHVRIYGPLEEQDLEHIRKPFELDGIHYAATQARILMTRGDNQWLELTLMEGKNREIRKIIEAYGRHINRLMRVSYGPFSLQDYPLNPGQVIEVTTQLQQLNLDYKKSTL